METVFGLNLEGAHLEASVCRKSAFWLRLCMMCWICGNPANIERDSLAITVRTRPQRRRRFLNEMAVGVLTFKAVDRAQRAFLWVRGAMQLVVEEVARIDGGIEDCRASQVVQALRHKVKLRKRLRRRNS